MARSKTRNRTINRNFSRSRGYWPTTPYGVRPLRDFRWSRTNATYTYNPISKKGYVTQAKRSSVKHSEFRRIIDKFSPFDIIKGVIPGPVRRIYSDPCKSRAVRREVLLALGHGGKGNRAPKWTKKSYRSCK